MKNFFVIVTATLLFSSSGKGQNVSPQNAYWQQEVHYQIEATLDTAAKTLHGAVLITYKNNSPDTLKKFYLQVPANAFFDEENTAVREMRRFQSGAVEMVQRADYQLTVQSVQFHKVGRANEFPLQAFRFRDTILDLPLPAPLLPGDSLVIGLNYTQDYQKVFAGKTGELPNRRRRNRPSKELQINFVHWFPRVAVYNRNGWNAEPFHFMMDAQSVYSEFASMDVTIAVPGNFVIVGSAEVREGDLGWDLVTPRQLLADSMAFAAWHDSVQQILRTTAPRRVRFRTARPAQNFIWSALPGFARMPATSVCPVNIFYHGATQRAWAKNLAREVDSALHYMQAMVGDYPFDQLTIVPATRRVTTQPPMMLLEGGEAFNLLFMLGRLHFPGIVGSNGVKESWMSNGLAFFFAKDFSEKRHGKMGYNADSVRKEMGTFAKLYPLPSLDNLMRNFTHLYMSSGANEPIANAIHQYKDPTGMVFNSFLKAELLYEMLRYVVGDSTFKEILHQYYREWQFKHADEAAFVEICERVSGQELNWFFNQWLHETPTVDYQKGAVTKQQRDDGIWVTEVEIKRKGDGIMPVEVELERSDGSKIAQRWDGKAESGKVVFETAEKPGRVAVDPHDQILDNNLLNNGRRRLEMKPDLPFMRYWYVPNDAYLVLWRPDLGYNLQDGFRLGLQARTSYRAFYHNLTLKLNYGFLSQTVDGAIAYSHPLRRKNVANRYAFLVRKVEGRFETDAHLEFRSSRSLTSAGGLQWHLGVNYSNLLDEVYTYREVANDTGKVKLPEWEDRDILFAYLRAETYFGDHRLNGEAKLQIETTLPESDSRFSKISGRAEVSYRRWGMRGLVRGNAATSFGPDPLPLQDLFHGEGAEARTRFRHDKAKTGGDWLAFPHRLVEGGGNLLGYTGTPLLAERYATFNLTLGPTATVAGFSLFAFYDRGAIWPTRDAVSQIRADAGLAFSFGGEQTRWFGSELFSELALRFYFPLWLSHPLPGEKNWQFRYYFALGKAL
ncbi:MAG: M1 family aminopeptidase [candidate division KSB1 bacterium]|nr:M1 family aminopeptidase [candidate division KSB1 bacterium]